MKVKTRYNRETESWSWVVVEGDEILHTSSYAYAFESSALAAGHDWIIDTYRFLDRVNEKYL